MATWKDPTGDIPILKYTGGAPYITNPVESFYSARLMNFDNLQHNWCSDNQSCLIALVTRRSEPAEYTDLNHFNPRGLFFFSPGTRQAAKIFPVFRTPHKHLGFR
jgi:hypothetical protein